MTDSAELESWVRDVKGVTCPHEALAAARCWTAFYALEACCPMLGPKGRSEVELAAMEELFHLAVAAERDWRAAEKSAAMTGSVIDIRTARRILR